MLPRSLLLLLVAAVALSAPVSDGSAAPVPNASSAASPVNASLDVSSVDALSDLNASFGSDPDSQNLNIDLDKQYNADQKSQDNLVYDEHNVSSSDSTLAKNNFYQDVGAPNSGNFIAVNQQRANTVGAATTNLDEVRQSQDGVLAYARSKNGAMTNNVVNNFENSRVSQANLNHVLVTDNSASRNGGRTVINQAGKNVVNNVASQEAFRKTQSNLTGKQTVSDQLAQRQQQSNNNYLLKNANGQFNDPNYLHTPYANTVSNRRGGKTGNYGPYYNAPAPALSDAFSPNPSPSMPSFGLGVGVGAGLGAGGAGFNQ